MPDFLEISGREETGRHSAGRLEKPCLWEFRLLSSRESIFAAKRDDVLF